MRAANDSLSLKDSVAKKATDVSHLDTAYLGPYLLLMRDPVARVTMNPRDGKKSFSACSASANPSGSFSAKSAMGPCVSTPGGGGGLCGDADRK